MPLTLRDMLVCEPSWKNSGFPTSTCSRTSMIWPPCGSTLVHTRPRTFSWTPGRHRDLLSPRSCLSCSSMPSFDFSNHLAFADDLSLDLNSEANANRLLEKVLQFERWSGLRLALSKSLITGILHGKGATRKASAKKVATAREFRGGVEKPPRAHL